MDYKNGKIYTIRSNQTDNIYIGSTCSPLSKRLYEHKSSYKKYLNGKYHFVSSYDILQYEDAYIELLEEYPCENKEQLCKREGELIRGGSNCVNKRIEGKKDEDYLKNYYKDNKEKLLQQGKEYRKIKYEKITCECGGCWSCGKKDRHFQSQKHQKYLSKNQL